MTSGPPATAGESSEMAERNVSAPAGMSAGPSSQNPYASLVAVSQLQPQPYATYAHLSTQNTWSMYPSGTSGVPASHYPQYTYAPYHGHYYPMPMQVSATPIPPNGSMGTAASGPLPSKFTMEQENKPPRSPSSPSYEHWDEALREFLREAKLVEALKGFECDMLVLNSEWERMKLPFALEKLIKSLSNTRQVRSPKGKEKELPFDAVEDFTKTEGDRTLDDRKLDYVHLAEGGKARTPTSFNKEISVFLAQKRARNDASNRAEFLLSLSEKRKRLQEDDGETEGNLISSCARTDAKTIDRDLQMKYDIAKNDDGPLRRTKAKKDLQSIATHSNSDVRPPGPATGVLTPGDEEALPKNHPGIDSRLSNIEAHLAVRYVPSPPRTLWARLKFIEDHIIKLEKDYPPWAALHFNQPHRGWPPPPRATPIIVPPHLRSSDTEASIKADSQPGQLGSTPTPSPTVSGAPKTRNTKSSLQRAVLERLQVQQAMGEK